MRCINAEIVNHIRLFYRSDRLNVNGSVYGHHWITNTEQPGALPVGAGSNRVLVGAVDLPSIDQRNM